jgi:uncharacterized flavoprotein (TIGR03862 family)
MAADGLAAAGVRVTVFDQMSTVGRKFLMAGRGGLNLTHSEPVDRFLARYGAAAERLAPAIAAFAPEAIRAWSASLGQPTFVGSSGRVFPVAFKASPLLRAWQARLVDLGVAFAPRHRWVGWDKGGTLQFVGPDAEVVSHSSDATVLALGGASWPRLGSDGNWVELVEARGVAVSRLRPANCGLVVGWSDYFRERFAGTPLKRIALSFSGTIVRGEAVVTTTGLEGGAIYALSAPVRDAIERNGTAILMFDLRPDLSTDALASRLFTARGRQSMSNLLRKAAGLAPVFIALLRETAEGAVPTEPTALAGRIKALPIHATAAQPLERAISTAGGIALEEIDENFMLRRLPGVFAAGEMLDWEAPTGGYLLQAAFATGAAAGRGALRWLAQSDRTASHRWTAPLDPRSGV